MQSHERMRKALAFEEPDRPPHFEIAFELTREAFGQDHPTGREFAEATGARRAALLERTAELYRRVVSTYAWDAVVVLHPPQDGAGVAAVKQVLGAQVPVGGIVWEGIWSIDIIKDWEQFAVDLTEAPEKLLERAEQLCTAGERKIDGLADAGADFICVASDVGFNAGPFLSPPQFRRFVQPFLARLVARVRGRGIWAFFHSDGQLLPVLDQILECRPHVLHSIDPMAGMDIAAVKRRTHGKLALMGNVQCSFLQEGPRDAIRRSARYCLEHGAPGGGYIFSTSNTVFRGVPLENYHYMLEVYRGFCARRIGSARGAVR